MKKPRILPLVLVTLAFLFTFIFASETFAVKYGSIGGRPADTKATGGTGWFIYNLDFGEATEDAVLVINTSEEETNVLVYAADSVRSSSGGFALRQMAEEKKGVGAWVRFYPDPVPAEFASRFAAEDESILEFCALGISGSEEWCEGVDLVEIAMEPEERREIPFTLSMPEDEDAGEHTGGILIQKAKRDNVEHEGSGITLTTRVGVRIYQTIPGDIIKDLYLDEFSVTKRFDEFDYSRIFSREEQRPETYLITTKVGNQGNVSSYFNQTITITDDLFGRGDLEITDRRFQVLRNDVFHSNYSWQNPRFGKFTISSIVTYIGDDNSENVLETEETTIWIMPWREIVLSAAVIALVVAILKTRSVMHKRKYSGKGWTEYTVGEGDTVDQIVKRHNADWEKFVKVNKLKPPYSLTKGQKVLVPPAGATKK
jgi:hypothetical protein